MKRLIIVLFLLFSVNCFSYDFSNFVLSTNITTSIPLLGSNLGEFDVYNKSTDVLHDAKLGKQSIGGSIALLYFINNKLAIGPYISYNYFAYDKASGLEKQVNTKNFFIGTQFKYYIYCNDFINFYVPFVIGYSKTKVNILFDKKNSFIDDGFAFIFGFGLDKKINKNIYISLESKYNYNKFFYEDQIYKIGNKANFISYSLGINYVF